MDIFDQLERVRSRDLLLRAAWTKEPWMGSPSDQTTALLDATEVLRALGTEYMLIGGIAVAVHTSIARATEDVDLAITTSSDLGEIERAFSGAGFIVTGRHAHSLNLRHRNGEPVQLAFDAGFEDAIRRAESCDVRGRSVRIATRADLIAMKERAASDPARRKSKALRDQADAELLRGDVPDPDEGW